MLCEELKLPRVKTIYRWMYEKYLAKGNVKVLKRKKKRARGRA